MRIALLIFGDIETVSGGYLYDRKLVEYLRGRGDRVEIVSFDQPAYWRQVLSRPDRDRLAGLDVDVVIQDELIHPLFLHANPGLKIELACPIVALVHLLKSSVPDPPYKQWPCKIIERSYMKTVDGLILNSAATRSQVRALMKGTLPPHVVAVPCADHFPPGAAAGPPAREGGSGAALKVLYVGAVTRQKGLEVLVETLAKLDGSFMLTVAGRLDAEPAYAARVRERVQRLGLAPNVRFTGPLPGAALPALYREHDVLVMPSVHEAYGIVYLEAMQFGLPAVGTTLGGAGEVIRDGDNGYLIAPGDRDALAGILDRLHRDRGLLSELGANARRAYLAHPRWQDTGSRIREFLTALVDRKKGERLAR